MVKYARFEKNHASQLQPDRSYSALNTEYTDMTLKINDVKNKRIGPFGTPGHHVVTLNCFSRSHTLSRSNSNNRVEAVATTQ